MRIAGRTLSSTSASTDVRHVFCLLWIHTRSVSETAHMSRYRCAVSRMTGVVSLTVLRGESKSVGSYCAPQRSHSSLYALSLSHFGFGHFPMTKRSGRKRSTEASYHWRLVRFSSRPFAWSLRRMSWLNRA
jgi:hypothetical protein